MSADRITPGEPEGHLAVLARVLSADSELLSGYARRQQVIEAMLGAAAVGEPGTAGRRPASLAQEVFAEQVRTRLLVVGPLQELLG